VKQAERIIDANANRAREALRVMEDAARFLLDDRELCALLKGMRHELRSALETIPGGLGRLLAHRDAPGDVGTTVATGAEGERASAREAAVAAGRRLAEALRSIEEHAKALAASDAAARIEALRYRAYDAERALTLALGAAGERFDGWRLCVLISEDLCTRHDWLTVATGAIEGGADCVQLREKDLPDGALLERARRLAAAAHERGAAAVINDRPDIALLAGADGVHLGQEDMTVEDARRIVGFDLIIGVSTAGLEEARTARAAGADYCGVGPMFATTTKRKDRLAGSAYLRDYLEADPPLPPSLAIGGITPQRLGDLAHAAAGRRFGVAVSSAVCGAASPREVCVAMRTIMDDDDDQVRSDDACPSNSSTRRSTTV